MARITPQQRQRYGPLLTGSVPGDVLKAIDDQELEDRLVQAHGLMQQVAKAATPGEGRRSGEQARRILAARPRAETEQIVVAKMAKARRLGDSPQAAALERSARDELLSHPPAVRRDARGAVAKAASKPKPDDDQLIPLYDAEGVLRYVGYPRDLQPVIPAAPAASRSAPRQAPPPARPQQATAAGAQVAKVAAAAKATAAEQVIKGLGPQWMPVYDWTGRLGGAVRRSDVTALGAGQVLKGAAAAFANVYDARRRRVGTAPMARIVHLADLSGQRNR